MFENKNYIKTVLLEKHVALCLNSIVVQIKGFSAGLYQMTVNVSLEFLHEVA